MLFRARTTAIFRKGSIGKGSIGNGSLHLLRSAPVVDLLLLGILLVVIILACGLGAEPVAPGATLRVIIRHLTTADWGLLPEPSLVDDSIIWRTRLPRVLVGAACGAGLAVAGLASQSTLRNVLADPYILGISSGASTGAAAVMVLGASRAMAGLHLGVGLGAFVGAVGSLAIVMLIAGAGGALTTTRVIFAGMAVNFFFSALTSFLIMMAKDPTTSRGIMFWMLGSLSGSHWVEAGVAIAASTVGIAYLVALGRRIDALSLGDDVARTLGIDPRGQRVHAFVVISFTIAFLVSITGTIGFVGLVVPHLAKRLHGGVFRRSTGAAALTGAIVIVLADLVARMLVAPGEMSIGIITSLLGAPLLMLLIGRRTKAEDG